MSAMFFNGGLHSSMHLMFHLFIAYHTLLWLLSKTSNVCMEIRLFTDFNMSGMQLVFLELLNAIATDWF